jgi:hypothetical protein
MRFNFETARHGKCLVDILIEGVTAVARIEYGPPSSVKSIEYRLQNAYTPEPEYLNMPKKLENAARFAVGHFDVSYEIYAPVLHFTCDSKSISWIGRLERVE